MEFESIEWILDNYTLKEIQEELFNRGLPTTGLKSDCATRIFNSQFQNSGKSKAKLDSRLKSFKTFKQCTFSACESIPKINSKPTSSIINEAQPKLYLIKNASQIGGYTLKGAILLLGTIGGLAIIGFFTGGDESVEIRVPRRIWPW